MIDRAIALAGIGISLISAVLPDIFPNLERRVWLSRAVLAFGVVLVVAGGIVAPLPDAPSAARAPSISAPGTGVNAAVIARQPPPATPPDDQIPINWITDFGLVTLALPEFEYYLFSSPGEPRCWRT